MKSWRDLEYAGWGFLGISFAVCVGPFVYVFYTYLSSNLQPVARILIGIFLAGVAAAFITFGANEFIQRSRARREEAEKRAGEEARQQRKLDKKLHRHLRKKAK